MHIAVQHPPSIPLQILAGPGSGKTKVLTARIANLISEHNIPPYAICAVTFTNKAASEMRERLTKLIGKAQTSQIKMGTFHALCATFLRRYPRLVGVEGNFTVCDADESKKIVKKLLEKYKQFLVERDISLKEATVLSMISKAKAKGRSAIDLQEEHLNRDNRSSITAEIDRVVAEIYGEYERILRRNNSLDFDDLLVFGVKLFSGHRKVGLWCQHVLVDEFQDTNTVQYELMKCIAAANKCVTIVGDPDQSIYGWRSAEIENLERMQKDFPTTQQIFLEQNYRSTASILAASMAIVSQDNTRVPKTLRTSCPTGPTPVLQSFPYDNNEAAFIAAEIKRLVAVTGGMLGWGDFVILLRFNALSRSIESALQKEGIPNRVLAGHKFFDRLEVKDILAYLQFVDNPHFAPAFSRAINVPGRSIGEKASETLESGYIPDLLSAAQRLQISPFEVVQRIYDGKTPDIKPPVKRKLASFLPPLRELRKLAQSGMQPPDLIRRFLDLIDYKSHLMKTQPDWESRWDNVQELINYASEVEITASSQQRDYDDVSDGEDTPLRLFLQASMLSTDTETQGDDGKEKVTIATCHAAKGLEWPVVMIPAVEKGTFPSSRAEDIHEERRLLYVACTRAQGLLYLSYSTARMVSGEVKRKEPSDFLLPLHGQVRCGLQPNAFWRHVHFTLRTCSAIRHRI
ncbi:hypothetical protein POSPLADRAFT_1151629 [Postia placenta MAD-698-R-SB12]|uniref:DNA 3'-5' helicase n=1 Tax=Postia placenta MAD-698-R-SB12 TaxID=670580 RepID=A0A1X6MRU7_9APHY|nr:hypothetical protein POSPLADRAFT_1151629 [Postia placenta MAD-698-R-SB12]OSX59010.1 hypothetical protein POSPLADRAFT_1151629 [Postia placenta MAD-698-R-SB12]